MKPISPSAAKEAKAFLIPDYVVDAVNSLLIEEFHPTSCSQRIILLQPEVIKRILEKAKEADVSITKADLFKNHYLDFEGLFKAEGWHVEYDSPAYNESYDARWIFSS